jgi:hypothetical protein
MTGGPLPISAAKRDREPSELVAVSIFLEAEPSVSQVPDQVVIGINCLPLFTQTGRKTCFCSDGPKPALAIASRAAGLLDKKVHARHTASVTPIRPLLAFHRWSHTLLPAPQS